MSLQRYYSDTGASLQPVITARTYIEREVAKPPTPFVNPGKIALLWCSFLDRSVKIIESLLGREILVTDELGELAVFSKSNRTLLNSLLSSKYISFWNYGARATDKPGLHQVRINIGRLADRSTQKEICSDRILSSFGYCLDPDTSMTVALAEGIERIATTEWSSDDFLCESITGLEMAGKQYFCKNFQEKTPNVPTELPMNWVKGNDLFSNEPILLPASLAYIFYNQHHPSEAVLLHTNSNACAAHSTKEQALLNAIYEAIERDGFLLYWLNTIAPPQIDLASIDDLEVQAIIGDFEKNNCTLHLLDCTTSVGIPTLVLVLIDTVSGSVDVSAVAELDMKKALKKIFVDALRWGSWYPEVTTASAETEMAQPKDLSDRAALWHGGTVRAEIDFFIIGAATLSWGEYEEKYAASFQNELSYVKGLLQNANISMYTYEHTHPVATEAGLSVMRVISPDLMPIYFVEQDKPLHVDRLYTFAEDMGHASKKRTAADLNQIPHPFI